MMLFHIHVAVSIMKWLPSVLRGLNRWWWHWILFTVALARPLTLAHSVPISRLVRYGLKMWTTKWVEIQLQSSAVISSTKSADNWLPRESLREQVPINAFINDLEDRTESPQQIPSFQHSWELSGLQPCLGSCLLDGPWPCTADNWPSGWTSCTSVVAVSPVLSLVLFMGLELLAGAGPTFTSLHVLDCQRVLFPSFSLCVWDLWVQRGDSMVTPALGSPSGSSWPSPCPGTGKGNQ